MGGGAPPRPDLNLVAIAALVVAVIAAGYLHALSYPFHFDDYSSIRDNPVLDHPGDLEAIWAFRPSRVIAHLSFALNIAAIGRTPAGLRAVNLLIHLVASLLVGWIAAELFRRLRAAPERDRSQRRVSPEAVGAIAALLFAAHPLATQAVTYIIQRTASLAALLELSAVALYLRARRGRGWIPWALSWTAAVLAALTKEMAIILPVAFVVLELALRRAGAGSARPIMLAPYLIVVPLVAWAAQLPSAELGRAASGLRETSEISRGAYFLTQLVVIPRYLFLWLWPGGQNLDPAVDLRSSFDPAVAAGLAVLIAASAGAYLARRLRPLLAVGWAWFLVTLIPESSLVPIRDVMVEHRTYLPMAGLCWGVAAILASFAATSRPRWIGVALVVVALTAVTHGRNRVWRDETSLWADVVRKSPGKARGYNNLAMALEGHGRTAEADSAYRRAIALEPDYLYARVNLGRLYGIQGRFADALRVLEEAQAIAPDQVEVLTNMGSAWWGLGDTTRAAAAYRRALEVAPGAREPAMNLARMRGVAAPR